LTIHWVKVSIPGSSDVNPVKLLDNLVGNTFRFGRGSRRLLTCFSTHNDLHHFSLTICFGDGIFDFQPDVFFAGN